jgi:hypothetical protein
MKILGQLAKFFAIIGGLLMVFITLMTVVSVIGRDTIGKAITGDFELAARRLRCFCRGASSNAATSLWIFSPPKPLSKRKARWIASAL